MKLQLVDNTTPNLSEPRQRLADLLAQRNGILESRDGLRDALQRLTDMQKPSAALDDLARLDEADKEAMKAWAHGGQGEAPKPDLVKREALQKRVADDQAQSASARSSYADIEVQHLKEHERLNHANAAVDAAIAEILIEEIESHIVAFAEANEALAVKASRLSVGSDIVLGIAEKIGRNPFSQPVYVKLEKLNTDIQNAFQRRAPEEYKIADIRKEWQALAERLRGDAHAKFER